MALYRLVNVLLSIIVFLSLSSAVVFYAFTLVLCIKNLLKWRAIGLVLKHRSLCVLCVAAGSIQLGWEDYGSYSRSILLRLHHNSSARRDTCSEDRRQSPDVIRHRVDVGTDVADPCHHSLRRLGSAVCCSSAGRNGRGMTYTLIPTL